MALGDFWAAMFGARYVQVAATEVAQLAYERTWELTSATISAMGEAEAKGYIRARAMPLASDLAEQAIAASPQLGAWAHTDLLEQSLKQLSNQIWERAEHLRQSRRQRRAA